MKASLIVLTLISAFLLGGCAVSLGGGLTPTQAPPTPTPTQVPPTPTATPSVAAQAALKSFMLARNLA